MARATQSEFQFLPYSPDRVLRDVQAQRFPSMNRRVHVGFVRGFAPLASISTRSWLSHISLNRALDRPDTPIKVMAHILTHELIHLEVPNQRIDGRWVSHPPPFWTRQRELSPEGAGCDEWIDENIGHCLATRGEGLWVCPRRLKR